MEVSCHFTPLSLMSCSKLATSSKKARKNGSVASWSWRKLRTNVLQAVLNGTAVSGIDKHVTEIVEDMTGHRLLPMPMLKDKLRRLAMTDKSKAGRSDWDMFLDKYFDRQIPPNLPFYKKQNGGLVECEESEALPRGSRWNLEIRFDTYYPRKKSRKKPWFRVHFRLVYRHQHENMHMPRDKLDVHCYWGSVSHYFKRYGDFKELMQEPAFLAHLRYLLLTQMHRLKDTKFCSRLATKGTGKRAYGGLCGAKCGQGLDSCQACLSKSFVDHFF